MKTRLMIESFIFFFLILKQLPFEIRLFNITRRIQKGEGRSLEKKKKYHRSITRPSSFFFFLPIKKGLPTL